MLCQMCLTHFGSSFAKAPPFIICCQPLPLSASPCRQLIINHLHWKQYCWTSSFFIVFPLLRSHFQNAHVLPWALPHCQFCLSHCAGVLSWFPISPLHAQHRLSNKNWQVRLITTSCKVFATFPTVCRLSLTQSTSKLRRLANLCCFKFSKTFNKS